MEWQISETIGHCSCGSCRTFTENACIYRILVPSTFGLAECFFWLAHYYNSIQASYSLNSLSFRPLQCTSGSAVIGWLPVSCVPLMPSRRLVRACAKISAALQGHGKRSSRRLTGTLNNFSAWQDSKDLWWSECTFSTWRKQRIRPFRPFVHRTTTKPREVQRHVGARV